MCVISHRSFIILRRYSNWKYNTRKSDGVYNPSTINTWYLQQYFSRTTIYNWNTIYKPFCLYPRAFLAEDSSLSLLLFIGFCFIWKHSTTKAILLYLFSDVMNEACSYTQWESSFLTQNTWLLLNLHKETLAKYQHWIHLLS